MKLYKKFTLILAALLALLIMLYFLGTGFIRKTNVHIYDYTISDDGTEMTIRAEVSTSMGYIRKATASQQPDGTLRLDFYSAFGGINGSIGAKNEFKIPLNENTTMISVYRSKTYSVPVLVKSDTGEWQFMINYQ